MKKYAHNCYVFKISVFPFPHIKYGLQQVIQNIFFISNFIAKQCLRKQMSEGNNQFGIFVG